MRDYRVALAQIGEFSVIVASEAGRLGVLDAASHELFLAIAVPTLVATPFLIRLGHRVFGRAPAVAREEWAEPDLEGHTVIVGYGVNGRNVARALRLLKVRHVVVDLNPDNANAAEMLKKLEN